MTQIIKSFETPNVIVRFSNIIVNPSERKVSLTVSTKEKGKRKFTEQTINATITSELYNWLTKLSDDKIKIAADNEDGYEFISIGTRSTSFQKYLTKKGLEFKSGILKSLVFESDNTSIDYSANPFRLVILDGRAVLTLVNVPSKKRNEFANPDTGEVKVFYQRKYGKFADGTSVPAFIRPEKYRRLVIQSTREVEILQ